MINNNKILTVSYGTFSCTLEGFEDSFGTMKAIAEYFRDLAADDRYFGAEPPQPDAEMLARIAEREVSRRVEARHKDGQIVLSALEDHSQPVADAPAPAATPPEAVPETEAVADTVTAAEPVQTPAEPDPAAAAPAAALGLAAGAAAAAAVETDAAPDDLSLTSETAEMPDLSDPVVDAAAAEVVDIVPGQSDADVEAFFEETEAAADPVTVEAEVIADVPAPEAPAPDSIAAKLQRIRAVVAQQDDDAEDEDFLEDEHAQMAARDQADAPEGDVLANARADIEDALDADGADAAEESADTAEDQGDDKNDVSDILQRLAAGSKPEQGEDSILSMDDDDSLDADGDAPDEIGENFFDDRGDADIEDADEGLLDDLEDDTADAPKAPQARVIKVARSEIDAAIEAGELEEYEDAPVSDEVAALEELDIGESTLSADDEDELAKELAAVEADLAKTDDEDEGEGDEQAAENLRHLPSRQSPQTIEDDPDSDVSRLMAETDTHMEDPDAANRRDAFAQLRAAVAAQKADSAISGQTAKADSDEAYRDDLAEVVRPRRPASHSKRTERPAANRPAPLKLVAEQRIDVDRARAAGPVRPRRVATVVETSEPKSDVESFADFAADMGAVKLPDLLEAAAAYMSFVEGRQEFSRPQLMNTVRQADPEDFSREDGLRSFGQLLRSGKIEKIEGGRFTVSEEIGFRPDTRAAG